MHVKKYFFFFAILGTQPQVPSDWQFNVFVLFSLFSFFFFNPHSLQSFFVLFCFMISKFHLLCSGVTQPPGPVLRSCFGQTGGGGGGWPYGRPGIDWECGRVNSEKDKYIIFVLLLWPPLSGLYLHQLIRLIVLTSVFDAMTRVIEILQI